MKKKENFQQFVSKKVDNKQQNQFYSNVFVLLREQYDVLLLLSPINYEFQWQLNNISKTLKKKLDYFLCFEYHQLLHHILKQNNEYLISNTKKNWKKNIKIEIVELFFE